MFDIPSVHFNTQFATFFHKITHTFKDYFLVTVFDSLCPVTEFYNSVTKVTDLSHTVPFKCTRR